MQKLMIMGGSSSFQERLAHFFRDSYQLEMTDSGEEGLSILRSFKPPMVLSGAHLPDMIGLEMLKRLQQELPQPKPILFSTVAFLEGG
jgi:CheY-like chemotaxis protein